MNPLHHRIGHFHPVWLPNTMTWLHRQITELNSYCENYIYCEKTENLEFFALDRLRCFSEASIGVRIKDRFFKKIGLTPGLKSHLDSMKLDQIQILHSHFGHIGVTGTEIAKKLKIPHVVSFYGMDIRQIPKKYPHIAFQYEQMFRDTERIFCEGPFMANSIVELGADPNQMCVHPLGIDVDMIDFCPKLWSTGSTLRVLIAASFRQKKGIPLALMALSVISKHVPLEISIVGDAGFDDHSIIEKNRIFEVVDQHQMYNIVHFLGYKSHTELLALAKDHHLFLQPSLHATDGDSEGGIPVTLIELAATGMCVIASNHCDIPSLVKDRETGWLSNENDLESLINTIERAIDGVEIWPTLASNARKLIESNFNASVQGKKLFEVYKGIIDG